MIISSAKIHAGYPAPLCWLGHIFLFSAFTRIYLAAILGNLTCKSWIMVPFWVTSMVFRVMPSGTKSLPLLDMSTSSCVGMKIQEFSSWRNPVETEVQGRFFPRLMTTSRFCP